MVFFFTGTGNSGWVAREAAKAFSDRVIAIGDYFKEESPIFALEPDEKVGFVFPIHSWGVPPVVVSFIKRVNFTGYINQQLYCIMTCGDQCGNAREMTVSLLADKGMTIRHIYSVQMPNNYIVMKGFGIDSKELVEKKKSTAATLLPRLFNAIATDSPVDHYLKGGLSFIKSGFIYKMFCKYSIDDKPFSVSDNCNSCGLCAKKCPIGNISFIDGKPIWEGNCTQCLACIHYCPRRAIEYGKATKSQGRYTFEEGVKSSDPVY